MRILVGCEESQVVCIELRKRGHEAFSCDILPCSGGHSEWHYQGDILALLDRSEPGYWDMAIFFPPCTYTCGSGLHWNGRVPGRSIKTDEAIEFDRKLLNANIPKIALENPVGCISSRIRKPSQIIQPYNFGEDASKKTCLWLKGLPPLMHTKYFYPRIIEHNGKTVERWGNQTDSGQNKLAPSETRGMERSKTYLGIAKAMAEQWG